MILHTPLQKLYSMKLIGLGFSLMTVDWPLFSEVLILRKTKSLKKWPPEEWLQFQDFPLSEKMSERMGVQRSLNWQEATSKIVEQYTTLIEHGVNPSQAIELTADTLAAQQDPI